MSYLGFARKYRPKNFNEVVGQQEIATTLQNAVKSNRVHHAYLFCGSRGVGKTSMARIFAKALNCEKINYQPKLYSYEAPFGVGYLVMNFQL